LAELIARVAGIARTASATSTDFICISNGFEEELASEECLATTARESGRLPNLAR
jgi:Tol biopolymer transport system component